jgi:hypothetical protein
MLHVCVCVHVHVLYMLCVYMNTRHVCVCVYIYIYTHTYAYIYTHNLNTHIYMHTHTYTHTYMKYTYTRTRIIFLTTICTYRAAPCQGNAARQRLHDTREMQRVVFTTQRNRRRLPQSSKRHTGVRCLRFSCLRIPARVYGRLSRGFMCTLLRFARLCCRELVNIGHGRPKEGL